MDEATARAVMERLGAFLDQFESCVSRRVQRGNASRCVEGLLNDSERKSMQAMHGRLADPGSYQGLQHFITHARWAAQPFWKRLREVVPVRAGLLLLDETSFPKQGRHSVGVARQYCRALGKVASCQVAVSSALRADGLTWPLAMDLYLPKEWAENEARCEGAGIPPAQGHREKWRIGLTQIKQIRAAGFTLDGVVANAEYGRVSESAGRYSPRSDARVRTLCPAGVSLERTQALGHRLQCPVGETVGLARAQVRHLRKSGHS